MVSGLPPPSPPSENTLTINISHEQLSRFEEIGFDEAVAVSPTRLAEGDYAYDVALDWVWAKVFYQQFKRPYDTGTIQNRKGTEGHIKFEVDFEQIETLQDTYGEGVAFLTFPLVLSRNEMPDNLNETIFVDVHAIEMTEPTLAYIHQEWNEVYRNDGIYPSPLPNIIADIYDFDSTIIKSYYTEDRSLIPAVHMKAEGGVQAVNPKGVKMWDTLLSDLLSCDNGILLRGDGDIMHIQEREPRPPATAVIFGGSELPEDIDW